MLDLFAGTRICAWQKNFFLARTRTHIIFYQQLI